MSEPILDTRPQLRVALLLALCGALATLAVLPYLFAMQPALASRIPVPLPVFALAQFVQGGALLILLSWIGLRCGSAAGLDAPVFRALACRTAMPAFRARTWLLACAAGLLAGALIRVLDLGFQDYLPPSAVPAPEAIASWKRALATLYGAVSEELICRLFLMTLVVWAALKLSGRRGAPGIGIILLGVLAAALLFGLLHLPATAQVWPLTPVVVSRALLLNAIGGIVFGILYWRYGLEHAMAAHLFADIAMHVLPAPG
ncbi:CPBP family glutamic-type intramembrane protease [Massilia sp. SYSU DXS3249]